MPISILTAAALAMLSQNQAPAPAQVMVLGAWHFANPGADMVNLKSEDVLTDAKQAQLDRLAAALAAYRPTKIMIERVATTPDLIDPKYKDFKPANLRENRDERVQVAYRLAARMGLDRVYAIDEQTGPGEPEYFPIDKLMAFVKAHNQDDRFNQLMGRVQQSIKDLEEKQAKASIAEIFWQMNDPRGFLGRIDAYYEFLKFGNTEDQPGADLNAMWYLRNAKIFGKLATVATPGDRILVLFGSGHAYWLRHFATNTPGFKNVDPRPYLRRAFR